MPMSVAVAAPPAGGGLKDAAQAMPPAVRVELFVAPKLRPHAVTTAAMEGDVRSVKSLSSSTSVLSRIKKAAKLSWPGKSTASAALAVPHSASDASSSRGIAGTSTLSVRSTSASECGLSAGSADLADILAPPGVRACVRVRVLVFPSAVHLRHPLRSGAVSYVPWT